MKPALTKEEWAARECVRGQIELGGTGESFYFIACDQNVDGCSNLPVANLALHALAALALHEQPFGFTHEDVMLLRSPLLSVRVHELADRIEALLPPTEP